MDLVAIVGLTLGAVGTAYTTASYYVERSVKRHVGGTSEQLDGNLLALVKSTRRLPVGCINFPPFATFERTANGSIFGELYVDLLRDTGHRANIGLDFVTTRASQIAPQLERGEVYAVACLLDTPGRVRLGDIADPRVGVAVVGVVRKDNAESWSHERLRDSRTTVAVVVGEVGEEIARTRYGATSENGRLLTQYH